MSNEVKRFFSSIKYTTDFFGNAEVEKVVLNKASDSFKVFLLVEHVLEKEKVDKLLTCSENGIEDKACDVLLKYKNITVENIKDYIDIYLEKLVKTRPSYCVMANYELNLDEKNVDLTFDMNLLKNEIKLLEKNITDFLEKYFFEGYRVNIKINKKNNSLKEEIEKNKNGVLEKECENFSYGKMPSKEKISIDKIFAENKGVLIEAYVFSISAREIATKRGKMYVFNMKVHDYTDSFFVKLITFSEKDYYALLKNIKINSWYKMYGNAEVDNYLKQLVLDVKAICASDEKFEIIVDNAVEKRVELHTHTMMSAMDSVVDADKLLKLVSALGHTSVAITDHNVLQAFPTLYNANKYKYPDLKILYGCELNVVDTENQIIHNFKNYEFSNQEFIAFDVETTGLNAKSDSLIEIGAVKFKDGKIISSFDKLIKYDGKLPEIIVKLTNITDELLLGGEEESEVLKEFQTFIKDLPLVAHNASFDKGFIEEAFKKHGLGELNNTIIDTMSLSRVMFPEWKNHKLTTLAKALKIEWDEDMHHRADYDSEKTALAFHKMIISLESENITNLKGINELVKYDDIVKFAYPFHLSVLVKNNKGLKNLFKIVSVANTKYLFKGKEPKIPRDELMLHRDGLLIGSGCINGEVFEKGIMLDDEDLLNMMNFYDYIEVYPTNVVSHLIGENKLFKTVIDYQEYVKRLIRVAEEGRKIVVATGDVHNLEKRDLIYRKIITHQKTLGRLHPLNREGIELPNQYFLTTEEMLDDFSYLEKDLREKIVIKNTNKISDMIGKVEVIKSSLYTPKMSNSKKEVEKMVFENAKITYGENLPEIIETRLNQELSGIIKGGYDVIYLISHKLVKKSNDDGYFVGSRGSVGSSLVATMMNITEVNPLPPHYICKECKEIFFEEDGETFSKTYKSGFDLPDKTCSCGKKMTKEGHDLPFATFLGFKAEKVPDIDLNFSGEYQAIAHDETKKIFGENNVYRAGTISTVASKTAFGFVKGYAEDKGLILNPAEVERLAIGCTGVKRTTGQHPGGIIVIPKEKDVFDFTPFQYPADEPGSKWYTTHFDFHAIEDNVLKLDLLGHDDPTTLKYLSDVTKKDVLEITFDDDEVMSLFSSCEVLGLKEEDILCKTGTLGIPEFGTNFVIRMLNEVKPSKFSDLVKISGLSHGTNVWQNNVRELIVNDLASFDDVVGCRDDIMNSLISYGLEDELAFKISEFVRKGKGKTDPETFATFADEMRIKSIPEWFIEMLKKIEYMFPKAHATAYVMMAYRVAWFKINYPLHYYSAYFSISRNDFDIYSMLNGYDAVKRKVLELKSLGFKATQKETAVLDTLNVALEMLARGYSFSNISLEKSRAKTFVIDEENKALIMPFMAMEGLGDAVAKNIEKERREKPFYCIEDFQTRSKINQTTLAKLEELNVFEGMDASAQMSLF